MDMMLSCGSHNRDITMHLQRSCNLQHQGAHFRALEAMKPYCTKIGSGLGSLRLAASARFERCRRLTAFSYSLLWCLFVRLVLRCCNAP